MKPLILLLALATTAFAQTPLIDGPQKLYSNTTESNDITATGAHATAGLARSAQIAPLDIDGQPSPSGKIVLLSIGMSNASQEWCGLANGCTVGTPVSFMGVAAAAGEVNHTTLAIVNGAEGGRVAGQWTSPTMDTYDLVRDSRLIPAGLSEKQVQVIWIKQANANPSIPMPSRQSDAFMLEINLAAIARATKVRYPNLRMVFLSSRVYGGYAITTLNPEPYAYEGGFSVKWVVESQVAQMRPDSQPPDTRIGDLDYNTVAPWLAWGPYLWANGQTPRSDGLTWNPEDFMIDGTHPSDVGIAKVASMLMSFFTSSHFTRCWFLAVGF